MVGSGFRRREEAELFESPGVVVGVDEVGDGGTDLLDVGKGAAVDDLFFQGPVEALGHAVGSGVLPRRRSSRVIPRYWIGCWKGSERYSRAVVHAPGQPAGGFGPGPPVQAGQPHGDRLQSGEPVALLAHVNAHALRVPVLDGGEDPHPAVVHGEDPGAVGASEHIGGLGGNGAVMGLLGTGATPLREEQAVFPHQPEHPFAGDPKAAQEAQSCPDLAGAFPLCTGPDSLDTGLSYAASGRAYCWRASTGVMKASFSRRHWVL